MTTMSAPVGYAPGPSYPIPSGIGSSGGGSGGLAKIIDASAAPYNVVGNTGTDQTANIQKALDAAVYPITGFAGNDVPASIVWLPVGRLTVSSPLKMNANQVLRGQGPANTYLVNTSTTTDVIQLKTGSEVQCEVSELGILGTATPATAGSGINFTNTGGASILGDTRHVVRDVVIVATFIGVTLAGGGTENRLVRVTVQRPVSDGLDVFTTDSFVSDCTVGQPGGLGISVTGGNTRVWGCKVYGGGNGFAAITLAGAGRHQATCCEVQDVNGSGYEIGGANCTVSNCLADSVSNAGFVVDGVGVADGSALIGCNTRFRAGGAHQPLKGFALQGASGCHIDGLVQGQSQSVAQFAGGTNTFLSYANINNSRGAQALATAAAITVDPYAGGVVIISTVAANITLNNPLNNGSNGNAVFYPEQELVYEFVINGVGGFTTTWGGDFVLNGALLLVANQRARITFRFDSDTSKWRETGRIQY